MIIELDSGVSYLPAGSQPLSADVGIVRGRNNTWFFDVGNNAEALTTINEVSENQPKSVVLSHFHPDHIGNLNKVLWDKLYVGENTYKYVNQGIVVTEDMYIEDGCRIHIFPIPACHAKGSLGMEIDEKYAFLGDATYSTMKKGRVVYNTQILKDEIDVLTKLKAGFFLQSHRERILRRKEEVLEELQHIYEKRQKNEPYIWMD